MPQPNVAESSVRGPLQKVSLAYRNKNYIGDRVFPIINGVDAKSKITKYLKGAWFRDEAGIRGPGSRAMRGGYPIDFVNITPVEYAFAKEVTDEDRRDAKSAFAPPLKPDEDALEFCADRIDLKKERRVAAIVTGSTWSTTNEDCEGKWAPGADNTFISDVEGAIAYIRAQAGIRPNVMMMSANVLPKIKQESSVLDRIKYTERGIVTAALIAAMFELEEVLIGDAIYSSAKETKAGTDFTSVNIWEKNASKGSAFVFYRPPSIGLKVPTAGLQARMNYDEGSARRVTTWRENAEHQDVYEVAETTDIVQTCSDLGYLLYDCILT